LIAQEKWSRERAQ